MKKFLNSRYSVLFIILLWGLTCVCYGDNVKKSVDENRDDNGDTNEESKDETMEIPVETESNNNVTCTRRQNSLMHEIRSAQPQQYPFMAALMSNLDVFLCSGTVVSNGMILTTASCTTNSIGYVLLNALKAKKGDEAAVLHVIKIEKFPTYTGLESLKDVAIVTTEKHNGTIASKIQVSNYTNTKNLIDIEAFGYGLNSDVGQTKVLQNVGLENRSPFEVGNVLKGYIDCIDTKLVTCFKDTGGPVIFDNELVGIVTAGQDECAKEMTSAYAVNKRLVTVLPTYAFKSWLDERIDRNEATSQVILSTYPSTPVGRTNVRLTAYDDNDDGDHHHRAYRQKSSRGNNMCLAQSVITFLAVFCLLN